MRCARSLAGLLRHPHRSFGLLLPSAAAAFVALAAGCGQPSKGSPTTPAESAAGPAVPSVHVVKPERATLRRTVRQPGAIQAFEQTPIYPKIPGYVQKWHVDIGDAVGAGQLLAELYVPEMVEELKQKQSMVKQSQEAFAVAKAHVATAAALVQEAQAGLQRAAANRERWQREYERLSKLAGSVIDAQVKDETWNQFQGAAAGYEEAKARVETAKATWEQFKSEQHKAAADIAVAEADGQRYAALVAYARLTAPFKGVVTRRNINTGDFVQPPTAGKGEPLYVVQQRDVVRIFVEVPETDAPWVHKGAAARIRVQALGGQEFTGSVVRTSYALDRTTRTLLAEVDLPNPEDRLRPGMYAFAAITAEHPNALTLPASAVVTQGDITQGFQTFCFLVADGKVRRTVIEVGVRDGQRVEVLKKQVTRTTPGGGTGWESFTGEERVVQDNVSALHDGQAVTVVAGKQ
jgi:multidrug efflux pump subunit AcrA (membrane-fusion protein)